MGARLFRLGDVAVGITDAVDVHVMVVEAIELLDQVEPALVFRVQTLLHVDDERVIELPGALVLDLDSLPQGSE